MVKMAKEKSPFFHIILMTRSYQQISFDQVCIEIS